MGKKGHLPPPPSSGNVVKCFCALVGTAKRPVDDLFVHYFHNLSSASGGFAPRPPLGSITGPRWGTCVPRPLLCPPLEKNRSGAYDEAYALSFSTFRFLPSLLTVTDYTQFISDLKRDYLTIWFIPLADERGVCR